MIGLETSVRVERSVEDAFAFVSGSLKFPLWNSAVQSN
jgi:hypothetical protein